MKNNKKTYWQGLEQLKNDPDFVKHNEKEFPEELPIKDAYGDNTGGSQGTGRRDFLKMMGFSVAAVSLAACEAPVRNAIPYLNKPETVDPGIPNYYASTYAQGGEYCSVVVKTREGRPIFVEGNTFSKVSKGGTSARVNASVLSLYDIEKLQGPTKGGASTDWATVDKEVSAFLSKNSAPFYIVANTILSPTTKKIINEFTAKYPSAKLVTYDPESAYGILEANKRQFGKAVVPNYDFSKANTIVSIGADFLTNWISGVEYTHGYTQNRKVSPKDSDMSNHFQFESILSVTGAGADYRTPIKPSQSGLVAAQLYNKIARATGGTTISGVDGAEFAHLDLAAKKLLADRGTSLVVSGSNSVSEQIIVNAINELLGNYGKTIDINTPSFQKQGNDAEMQAFVKALAGGKVGGVLFYNCNPVYDYPQGKLIEESISKAKLSISTADRADETASKCGYVLPDSHYLESWSDAEPKKGFFSLCQPTINKIFDTRQVEESLLKWAGNNTSIYQYLQDHWKESIFTTQTEVGEFTKFWQRVLHNGVYDMAETSAYTSVHEGVVASEGEEVVVAGVDINSAASAIKSKATGEGLELVVYTNPTIGTGAYANNPMLQETPEPISRVCWGNFVSVSQSYAREKGVAGDFETKKPVAKVKVGDVEMSLPVIVQPGQEKNTIAIALGYGRGKDFAGKVAAEAGGVNAFPFVTFDGSLTYSTANVDISFTGEMEHVAQTQTHHTIMGRESIIQESTLATYKEKPKEVLERFTVSTYSGATKPSNISLWDIDKDGFQEDHRGKEKTDDLFIDKLDIEADRFRYKNHHWGMSIDLNACTGCAACVVACHMENNVPVVGKQEVINRREMHWLRIDRYYSNPAGAESNAELEEAADNPEVVFQPMMCQHCNSAPCETVCPVAATTHSSEGLNMMTYNRCIGTKYCANNCPYKVRRFNWFKYHANDEFDYHMNNKLGKMVLNPDVTVRSRGVMEKCSMCVQRLQAGKLKAKIEGRTVVDSDAQTACASACTAGAITFGDLNNKQSKVRETMDEQLEARAYNVLDELNVSPNVWYLAKIRNKEEGQA
ncbi:TAT-variant-translocated molybdopterin oxidoreductase [Chondrinema litorale]|uniref:TAT-variant-translocated molybdopterin oxidoreductase n=1 Tax=Chondrinema litorale TaxID=2994555 RepID=UPI0025446106|nr:TAT-variant-translocated molybdopterin oxidoreductase [Chondrinema litorale]UZR93099.1 TAT-variant-translocated molybdopterin oxidoreductase [Chondrinema litorale]